ncbi:hypothetical protein AB2553_04995 [Bacillus mycoides]|uniref:hypothetical protein n=1 Tax=Bacillus mycoides TaxID=1405 RepID=UPI00346479BD
MLFTCTNRPWKNNSEVIQVTIRKLHKADKQESIFIANRNAVNLVRVVLVEDTNGINLLNENATMVKKRVIFDMYSPL